MLAHAHRVAKAERFRDYFDLQLRLARTIVALRGDSLARAVALYTNFHRRFGLGRIQGLPTSNYWRRYTSTLERLTAHERMVAWTQECFARAPEERLPVNHHQFGCFSCAPPNRDGLVRIHFSNKDSKGGSGPLSRANMENRTRELKDMFAFVRRTFPSANGVQGGSWIYNLEAYRRLFPPEFGASRELPRRPICLHGSSSWGQFLDHRNAVKPELREEFLDNLKQLDMDHPWRAFPMPARLARAPIGLFYEYYSDEPHEQTMKRFEVGRTRASARGAQSPCSQGATFHDLAT